MRPQSDLQAVVAQLPGQCLTAVVYYPLTAHDGAMIPGVTEEIVDGVCPTISLRRNLDSKALGPFRSSLHLIGALPSWGIETSNTTIILAGDHFSRSSHPQTPWKIEVYDVATNSGWVSVGTDHDTAAFALATI